MPFNMREGCFPVIIASILFILFPFEGSINSLEENTMENRNSDLAIILPINGQSFLNFTDSISPNSQVNASWYAEVIISESYGTELLENRSMGILWQIDEYLGNSDGWLDNDESQFFSELVASSRNWSDSESGGCCSFDYNQMDLIGDVEIHVTPPETGPTNRTGVEWGWTESATISGAADGRTLRLIDIPRAGAIIEEVPLTIQLPDYWEFRYSPMSDLITGSPGLFTVNRSLAPVAHDIRITITQNIPPIISANKFPSSSSHMALDRLSMFSASCSDSPLDDPQINWTVSREGQEIAIFQNSWFELVPSDLNLSHGEVISVNATCLDFHGTSSYWNDNPTIDGLKPSWNGTISISDSIPSNLDPINLSTILAPAGSTITLEINGSDDSSQPVLLELYSDISEGWRQSGISNQKFTFTVNQGNGINGADMDLNQRHLERNLTEINLALLVTDDAGNTAIGEWVVQVLDSNSPTVIPRIYSNGIEVDLGDGVHENDELEIDLSHSYDDIDSIANVTWSIWVDGKEISWESDKWSISEPIRIPKFSQGVHEIVIKASDSKGNLREESVSLTVHPKRGAHISVVEVSLSEDSKIGSNTILTVIAQNDGSDAAFARVCLSDICGRWTEQPFSSSLETGPETSLIEFQFEMKNDSLEGLYLNWDSASAGTNGKIPIEIRLDTEGENRTDLIFASAIAIASICLLYFIVNRQKE